MEMTAGPEVLPSISIVVPNYNGGATLAATLQSLIEQNYPNLEILVVDGGSTDNSTEVIRRYKDHISWWVTEKDRGQSHAINKGFARATGDIVNWLCSDDVLLPGALHAIARYFTQQPEVDVVVGRAVFDFSSPKRKRLEVPEEFKLGLMPCTNPIPQLACFYRRSLLVRQPPLDESLHFSMDLELWIHLRESGAKWLIIPEVLGVAYFSSSNKCTVGGVKITLEIEDIYRRYIKERIPLTFWHRHLRYPVERLRRRYRGWLFGLIYYPYQILMIALLAPFYGFSRVRWMNWTEFG